MNIRPRSTRTQSVQIVTRNSSALLWALAVASVFAARPDGAFAQAEVPGVQRIKQFLTVGPPARRRIDTNLKWGVGSETLFTTNTFLEADEGGPFVECLEDNSRQPLEDCGFPESGPVFEFLPRQSDGEPNEAVVIAATSEFNIAYARRNYLLNGGGDVALFQDSETDQIRVNPSVRLLGRTGFFRDYLTIDASASAQRASISEVNVQSTNPYANLEQRGLFVSGVLRPTLVLPITQTTGASLQYSRRQTWQLDDSGQDDLDTAQRGQQSVNTYSATVYGSSFDEQLELSAAVTRRRAEFHPDDADEFSEESFLLQDTVVGESRFAVTDYATLVANGGVDEVETSRADNRQLDGTFWAVGVNVRGRSFDAEALAGLRYDGFYYRAELNYVLRNFVTLTARATRQLEIQFGAGADANLAQAEQNLSFYDDYGRVAFATPLVVDGQTVGFLPAGIGEGLQGGLSPLLDFRNALDQSSGERGAPGLVDRLQGEARFRVAGINVTARGGVTAFDFGDVESQISSAGLVLSRNFSERYGVEFGLSQRWSVRDQCLLPADTQEFCVVDFSVPDLPQDLPQEILDRIDEIPPDELSFRFEDQTQTLTARARFNARFSPRFGAFVEAGHLDGEQGPRFNGSDAARDDVSETYVRIGVRWGGRR